MINSLICKLGNFIPTIKNLVDERQLTRKIKNGLQNGEFRMYLQFIADAKTGELTSAEALSRWHMASGELVMPGKYIGLMEKNGLISEHDYYMLEKACAKLSEWKDSELSAVSISCNFTRLTISEADFVSRIKSITDRYSFDRSKLIMEITEDITESNYELATANVKAVKELGFTVALDDIGSGCTSFTNLFEYPVDIVKIDREILLMASNAKGENLLCGIVSLSHSLGMKVVLEGVETEVQNTIAKECGCDYIQGWYYSKPLPQEEAEMFARNYSEKSLHTKGIQMKG